MSDGTFAVELRCGRLRLVIGGEVGVTAAEIISSGDLTRLDIGDLPGTRCLINDIDGLSEFEDALLIIENETRSPTDVLVEDVEVRSIGDETLRAVIHSLSATARKGIVAEAALTAWRQRLADAADSLDPLTNDEAEIPGRLDIPGRPLITELRADRRRRIETLVPSGCSDGESITTTDGAIAELRAAIRFGAAGLTETPDGLLPESINLACKHSGWVTRLRLLLAAEEIATIELVAACSNELRRSDIAIMGSKLFDQALQRHRAERLESEALAALFDEVVHRLPADPKNPATRLFQRRAISDAQRLRRTVTEYSSIVRSPAPPAGDAATWAAATQSLLALEQSTSTDKTDGEYGSGEQSTHSVDEVAALLGELFANRLPAARTMIADVRRQHPGVEAEGQIQIIKRQAIRKLGNAQQPGHSEPVAEIVAELAMSIALLRGFTLRTDKELHELGRRLLARADRIATLQARAGHAIPMAANGFKLFAQQIQPLVMEYLFHRLGGVKPTKSGAARDAYKFARSKVWRARHDGGMADAAAGGATEALARAIDAGAPRLIVRYIDRELRIPQN